MPRDRIDLDLHRLELRFADSRLVEPRAVERLAESMRAVRPDRAVHRRGGSRASVWRRASAGTDRRLSPGRRAASSWPRHRQRGAMVLRSDRGAVADVGADAGSCVRQHRGSSAAAYLGGRAWSSQHEVARRSGRDVSWVSRRLQSLSGLPDAALAAVRDGHLSSWQPTGW